jgi:vacuolar protein sorting-associated protein 53
MEEEKIITPEFYYLLKQYTGSDDPLEDPSFDPVAYLNEKFPDFKSLDKLPNLIEDFEKQISELDEEIDELMCERAIYNEEMKSYMNELNNDVTKIIELVQRIKNDSDINETTVKMICNDIKNLDNARNNITTTISSLTKLIILITGIEKLESFVKGKSFKEAANAIAASNDILEYFKEYKHVTQVSQLYSKKEHLCTVLLGSILDEFKNNIGLLPNNSEHLHEACLAINAIGENAVKSLKTWFTQYKLTPYEEIFDPKASNPIHFEDTERRFEWLKRTLKEYSSSYENVFPASWGVKSGLCQEFCRITKLHLNETLMMNLEDLTGQEKYDSNNSNENSSPQNRGKKIDVDVLVRVLNNTINFENNLHSYLICDYENFNKDNAVSQNLSLVGIKSTSQDGKSESDSHLDEIKSKYNLNKPEGANSHHIDPNTKPLYTPFRVKGVISESFEPYMISYVNIEEKKLKGIIDELKHTDRIEGKLLVSSLHLFNNIKQAMNRCLTFSKSKTFYDLSRKFKDVFSYYNEKILGPGNNRLKFPDREKIKLFDEDLKYICYIINTADYCITTINALVDSLRDKIEEKYKNQICYDDVIDFIKQNYKNAFDLIMAHVRNLVNEQLVTMSKMTWTSLGDSNNISSFVLNINKNLDGIFTIIKEILQDNLVYHILNSMPSLITNKFLENLYKVKKIDEGGAQKLMMDIYELKGMISKIYTKVSGVSGVGVSQSKENDFNLMCLNQAMKKEFGKVESRLKCLGSLTMEMGNAYKTFVEDKSRDDFDKLLLIRGVKKNEIPDYEKIFI